MRRIYVPPWRIDIERLATVPRPLSDAAIAGQIARALDSAGAPRPATVALHLTDDRGIEPLNEQHLGHAGPTDVLSFPLLPPSAFPDHVGRPEPSGGVDPGPSFVRPPGHRAHLGEIVVSVERAIEQAEAGRGGHTGDVHRSAADELRLLVTHGTLHLCGWDHADPSEEAAMRALERRLLEP